MCRSSLTRLHVRLMLPLHRFVSMTQSRTHRKDTHCRGALANCFRDGAPENAGTERLAWQPGTSARVASASSDASESRKRERSWEIERSHCCGTCTPHSAGQRRVSTWSTDDNEQGWGRLHGESRATAAVLGAGTLASTPPSLSSPNVPARRTRRAANAVYTTTVAGWGAALVPRTFWFSVTSCWLLGMRHDALVGVGRGAVWLTRTQPH